MKVSKPLYLFGATVRSAVEKSTPAIAAGVVGGLVVAIVLGYLIYRGGSAH